MPEVETVHFSEEQWKTVKFYKDRCLTPDEAKRVLYAVIFGDPAGSNQPDPALEVAKQKLREIAALSDGKDLTSG